MSTTVSPVESARAALGSFSDRLIGPEDPRYDESRALFNAMVTKRPALIARCGTADDVAAVIRFAREHDLPFAVRGGGHNWGGLASVDDGVDRPLADEVRLGRPRHPHRAGRRRLCGERSMRRPSHTRRGADGDHLEHRCRRLTLGGGHGYLSRRHAHDRQPVGREDGARGRLAGDGERGREPRPLLGDPRRR